MSYGGRKIEIPAFTARLTIGVLTFVVGASAATVWLTHRRAQVRLNQVDLATVERNSLPEDSNQPQVSFAYRGAASVMTVERGCIDVHMYRSNDGLEVSMMADVYDSPTLAAEELQRMLEGDVGVIERKAMLDEQGRRTGERVAAQQHFDRDKPAHFLICKTQGAKLYRFGGSSLQHVIALEKSPEALNLSQR